MDEHNQQDVGKQVRLAQSCASDAKEAVRQLHRGLTPHDAALVLFFCSSLYDLDVIAKEISGLFAGVNVVGCTTAGEIGPAGYVNHSISGVSFSAGAFTAVVDRLDHLLDFDNARCIAFAEATLQRLRRRKPHSEQANECGFMLIDGLSMREERVSHAFQGALGRIPLVGGSAGDDQKFEMTWIYHNGRFHRDSAALVLLATQAPLTVFKTQHFAPTSERLVVTGADPDRRVVTELNGEVAATAYARLLGMAEADLTAAVVARAVVIVLMGDSSYVRSIQKVNPDGSMTFYCAIENGLVLRMARETSFLDDLEDAFRRIEADIGPPQLVIGCDCIQRRLVTVRNGLVAQVEAILCRNNMIGFSTYGEQFGGIHVNQTLTGIAIGAAPEGRGG